MGDPPYEYKNDKSNGFEDYTPKLQYRAGHPDHSYEVNQVPVQRNQETDSSFFPTPDEEEFEHARKQWDNVETVRVDVRQPGGKNLRKVPTFASISFAHAFQHFENGDLNPYKRVIQTNVIRTGFQRYVYLLFGPANLKKELKDERDLIFCMAACPFSNSDIVHVQMLQTIYGCMTGSKFACPRFGGHWDEIGFQGNDPATDLRGTGMLALVNLLYLTLNPHYRILVRDLFRMSRDTVQNFPFCVMGINFTRLTLQVMREGFLNKECNRRMEMAEVFSEFYVAVFLRFYEVWRDNFKTIADSGFVIKELESFCKKNPSKVLKNLKDYVTEKGGDAPLEPRGERSSVLDDETVIPPPQDFSSETDGAQSIENRGTLV